MILITIGRNSGNKIVIDDPSRSVSGYHAELKIRDDGSIFITDKSSTNGTSVKGSRIQSEVEVSINRGDKITFAGVADLNWSVIPIIAPPPIGWKLYSIGSDLNNRIQITDGTNSVSRFHATLKIDTKGKAYINDHSSNGTFVNGSKIPSNQDIPVKRKDRIVFANNIPFDWSKVKEKMPIPFVKIAASIAAVLVISLCVWQGNNILDMFGGKWTLGKTQQIYGGSIVCVNHTYQVVARFFDGQEYVLGIDEDGDLVAESRNSPQANMKPFIKSGEGTAFFVDRQGTMITNRHITMPWEEDLITLKQLAKNPQIDKIYGATLFIGIVENNTGISRMADFIECSILSETTDNESKDIGMLRTKNKKLPSNEISPINLEKAILNSKALQLGEEVYLIGYPLGTNMFAIIDDNTTTNTIEVKQTAQQGAISQLPDKYKFGHNAASFGGASGSPIFNKRGQLVGIHNSGLSQAGIHGYSWGVLAKHAKELYDKE